MTSSLPPEDDTPPPQFITETIRDQLENQWTLDRYDDLVAHWAQSLDQPHIIATNRIYLEKLWQLQPPSRRPVPLIHLCKTFWSWLCDRSH